jgi:hypothetical protein
MLNLALTPKTENPAREEVRRVSETDQQPGGGGVASPIEEHWEEECVLRCFDHTVSMPEKQPQFCTAAMRSAHGSTPTSKKHQSDHLMRRSRTTKWADVDDIDIRPFIEMAR